MLDRFDVPESDREAMRLWVPAMLQAFGGDLGEVLRLMRQGQIPPALALPGLASAIEAAQIPVAEDDEKFKRDFRLFLATLGHVLCGERVEDAWNTVAKDFSWSRSTVARAWSRFEWLDTPEGHGLLNHLF